MKHQDFNEFDQLAGMKPAWLVTPLVSIANSMAGPLFIVEFVIFLIAWMVWNTVGPAHFQFDRWPFMGLNLFMSALAGIQAAVIGVKQTLSDYKRDYETAQHNHRYQELLKRIVSFEESRAADAVRREELQSHILTELKKLEESLA